MREKPPFRAEHVGSLLRSKEILEARQGYAQGLLTADERRRVEDEAIRQAVRMQEALGFRAVTDGELRRGSWHMDFLYQIGGVTKVQDNLKIQFKNEDGGVEFTPAALRVTGKLKLETCIFGEDFSFLKSITTATPKLTIPAPSLINYRGGRAAIDPAIYPDIDEFWNDVGQVFADEVEGLDGWDARTCKSTTPASRISTIPASAPTSPRWAATASSSISPTSRRSTRPSRGSRLI